MPQEAVIVENLVKYYPRVKAVDGVSFTIKENEIFGLLGPNGAGKTTSIRIMLTLIQPTSGNITTFGLNALQHSDEVRAMAGYVPQDVSADGDLTAYENMLIYSKLYDMPAKDRKQRIKEILGYLDLSDRINLMVNTFSGGMMRRLELAQALVNRPKLLYLDEPSIGLDPNARNIIWGLIKKLREEFGTTILITTHDMYEVDVLCDRIGIMDHGKLVTLGSPTELKNKLGGDVITINSKSPNCHARLVELGYSVITAGSSNGNCDLVVNNGEMAIPLIINSLKASNISVESVSLKKPTLDDVFLKATGARIDQQEGATLGQIRRERKNIKRFTR